MELCGVVVGLGLVALLVMAWWMDRAAQRRGSRATYSGDVWRDVRESRRDAEVLSAFRQGGRPLVDQLEPAQPPLTVSGVARR